MARCASTIRRNKLAFTAAATIAGALLMGAMVSTWQAVRAKKAEAKANV
jgi:eukaryotic-like serine/threonine-protein kinase